MDISSIIINLGKLDKCCAKCGQEVCICAGLEEKPEMCDACGCEPCICDNSVTCANEMPEQDVGSAIAELVKLTGGAPVTESILTEITDIKAPAMDALRHLGNMLTKKAEQATLHGRNGDNPELSNKIRNMSRVGGILADLGGPEETVSVDKISKPDWDCIASTLNVPVEKLMRIVGIREGVEMTPFQAEDDMEPMSKKQAMGDQPLVNNTADNSMIDAEDPVKKYAVKTIKETSKLVKQTTLPSGKRPITLWKDEQGHYSLDSDSGSSRIVGANSKEAKKAFDKEVRHMEDKPNVKTIKEHADLIREMEKLEEAYREGDVVRVASDNSYYGDMTGHVIRIDRDGDVVVDLEDFGEVKIPAGELQKNHAMHPMFERSEPYANEGRIESAIDEAIENFSMEEFLEHNSGEIFPDDKEEVIYSTQDISSMIRHYLAHWIQIHTDVEEIDPSEITDGDVKGLMNKVVLPYMREANFRIAPELKTVEGMEEHSVYEAESKDMNKNKVCPICHLSAASCDCDKDKKEETKDAKKDLKEAFTYGDKVVIVGDKHHLGDEGEVVSFDNKNGTVVVNLHNHGRHNFPVHCVVKDIEEEGALLDADEHVGTVEQAAAPVDLHLLSNEIENLSDDEYNNVMMELFGHGDPERIISTQHIIDQLTSLPADRLMDLCMEYDLCMSTVDEGNAHDDLRAKKSDHDTLMHKNIEDAKHLGTFNHEGHEVLDEDDFEGMNKDQYAKMLTDKVVKMDDKQYIDACKILFPASDVYKMHDKGDILVAILNSDKADLMDLKELIRMHETALSKIGMESEETDEDDDVINEKAAPGQEAWIKSNKDKFVKEYGKKKGLEVLYATAQKRADESIETLEKSLNEEFNNF